MYYIEDNPRNNEDRTVSQLTTVPTGIVTATASSEERCRHAAVEVWRTPMYPELSDCCMDIVNVCLVATCIPTSMICSK
jgi:hypothetical protein